MRMVEVDVPAQNSPYFGEDCGYVEQVDHGVVFMHDIGDGEQFASHGGGAFAGVHAVYDGDQAIAEGSWNGVFDDEVAVGFEEGALVAGEPVCKAVCIHICRIITAISRWHKQGLG